MTRIFKKLWPSVLALILCAVPLTGIYNLYTAWASHTIYGGRTLEDVSYEVHPALFWFFVAVNVAIGLASIGFLILVVMGRRKDKEFWRKRAAAPPVEHDIRQSVSEQ